MPSQSVTVECEGRRLATCRLSFRVRSVWEFVVFDQRIYWGESRCSIGRVGPSSQPLLHRCRKFGWSDLWCPCKRVPKIDRAGVERR